MKALACILTMVTLAGCTTAGNAPAPREPKQYSVADLYKNVSYGGASFSHDEKRLLVASNKSGIYNAYAIPISGGEPEALTQSTKDSIRPASFFPKDDRILFTSDEGGNELSHLYVRDQEGSTKDLTPGKKVNAQFFGWADDDKSFFVLSNERDENFFDLYEYDTANYSRKIIYKNEKGFDPSAVSRDKRYIALTKTRTTNDQDVWLFDRQTGKSTNITAHEGNVMNSPADFSPDGSKLLFISDEGREFQSLRSYEIAGGAKSVLLAPNWDVQYAAYTKSGKRLIVSINEDAANTTRLYDPMTLQEIKLSGLPSGVIRGLQISRSDQFIAFYSTDGSVPNDLYAGPLNGAPTRLTNALNPDIQREDLVAPEKVRFKSYDGVEVPGLIYKPHQARVDAKAPALVSVHGGPGGQSSVGYSALTQALVNHGYVVYSINNRGSSGYGKTFYAMDDRKHGEADLGDVVASKQMLVGTGYVDENRIGIIGGSYGGYMVLAALTLQPDAFKTGVDLFGISNWIRTLENTPPWWASFREALFAEMGDPKVDGERLHRISPLFNATKIKAPLMVLQGANDPRVLKVESDEIVEAAKKNGVVTEYIVFPDEGHGFVKKENEVRGYTAVIEFLDKHLKTTTATP